MIIICQKFFDSMGIAEPDFNLNINNVSRGQMIGRMISGIDKIFLMPNQT